MARIIPHQRTGWHTAGGWWRDGLDLNQQPSEWSPTGKMIGAVVSSALLCATVPDGLENGCELMYDN